MYKNFALTLVAWASVMALANFVGSTESKLLPSYASGIMTGMSRVVFGAMAYLACRRQLSGSPIPERVKIITAVGTGSLHAAIYGGVVDDLGYRARGEFGDFQSNIDGLMLLSGILTLKLVDSLGYLGK